MRAIDIRAHLNSQECLSVLAHQTSPILILFSSFHLSASKNMYDPVALDFDILGFVYIVDVLLAFFSRLVLFLKIS